MPFDWHEMEAVYAKLYEKYTKLKKKNFSQLDGVKKEQEDKFINYVSAADDMVQYLQNENQNLQEIVENLRSDITSIRSTKEKECLEYQTLLVEQEKKNRALSREINKLKELIQEGPPGDYEDQSGRKQQRKTPETVPVKTRNMRKRRRGSEDMVEMDAVLPHIGTNDKATDNLLVSQPQCCQMTYDGSSNTTTCTFQALVENLLGMKLSTSNEGEVACITALHPSSGLSFSLTQVNKPTGEESELRYKIVSLGTLEGVAPEWMKNDIMFSTSMCPVFFERVSRVIKC